MTTEKKSNLKSDTILLQQKIAKKTMLMNRWRSILPVLVENNPLNRILIPLYMERIEKFLDKFPGKKTYVRFRNGKREEISVNIRKEFKDLVDAYKDLPITVKRRYINTAYLDLRYLPSENRTGKELLHILNPNYKRKIKSIIEQSFNNNFPRLKILKKSVQSQKISQIRGMKKAPTRYLKIQKMLREVQQSRKSLDLKQLKSELELIGNRKFETRFNQLHAIINQTANRPLNYVLNLNGQHFVKNYYKYRVEFDHFYCSNDNEWADEPYFIISAGYPLLDLTESENMQNIYSKEPYAFRYHNTGTWEDVDSGEERRVGGDDREILDNVTFNNPFSFTFDFWESDWSTHIVVSSAYDVLEEIREDIGDYVRDQLFEAIEDVIVSIVGEMFNAVAPDFMNMLRGLISAQDFLSVVEDVFGGIDISWIGITYLFSGADLLATLSNMGLDPTSLLVVIGLKIGIPVITDFFENLFSGNIGDALMSLFSIPYEIGKFVYNFFKSIFTDIRDLVRFIINLPAVIDPDDHIGTHTVRVTESNQNIFEDCEEWEINKMGWYDTVNANNFFQQKGWGATKENSSFLFQEYVGQPVIRIKSGGTDYNLYYNVKRELVGGVETFGFTLMPGEQKNIRYKVKSPHFRDEMVLQIMALNSEEIPFVYGYGHTPNYVPIEKNFYNFDQNWEMKIPITKGERFEIYMVNLWNIPLYGYLVIKEDGLR